MLMSRDNSKTSNIKLCFSVTIDDVFSSFGSSFKNWICIIMQACQMKAVSFLRCMCAKSRLSCPTLCDPKDRSPPGSSVHGILQARILDWAAMPSSERPAQTQRANLCLLQLLHCRWSLYC